MSNSEDVGTPFFSGDESIFKMPIALYFGGASTVEYQEELNNRAIDWDFSLARLINEGFKVLVRSISKPNESGDNYFDVSFRYFSGIPNVRSPRISTCSYVYNGERYPALIFEDGYLLDSVGVKRFFLRDEIVEQLGKEFELDFSYEFIEFKRLSKSEHRMLTK